MKYQIRYEQVGNEWHYMIYERYFLLGWMFLERWNTPESARTRLGELTGSGVKEQRSEAVMPAPSSTSWGYTVVAGISPFQDCTCRVGYTQGCPIHGIPNYMLQLQKNIQHSIECRFQHFLSSSNLSGQNEDLRKAYYAGAGVNPPIEPVSQACPVCDEQPKSDG